MDIWDKEKRSAVMAKIRSKDTKPELIVRRYLYHRGECEGAAGHAGYCAPQVRGGDIRARVLLAWA